MSRMIDADELNKVKFHPLPYTHIVPNGENAESYERGWNDAIDAIISDAPTVDAVPVVRCKDCKWWDKVDNIDGVNYGTCERKCTAIRKDAFLNENWFCADGERREK